MLTRHLAKDEMEMITEDRWTEEVWGAATSTGTNRQDTANQNLIFYWGQGVRPPTRFKLCTHISTGSMGGKSHTRGLDCSQGTPCSERRWRAFGRLEANHVRRRRQDTTWLLHQ